VYMVVIFKYLWSTTGYTGTEVKGCSGGCEEQCSATGEEYRSNT